MLLMLGSGMDLQQKTLLSRFPLILPSWVDFFETPQGLYYSKILRIPQVDTSVCLYNWGKGPILIERTVGGCLIVIVIVWDAFPPTNSGSGRFSLRSREPKKW